MWRFLKNLNKERNMHIIMILTNSFDPDPRVYKEAKSLIKLGATVEILAWDRQKKFIDNSIEDYEGISVKRFYSHGKYGSGAKQILGYLKFIIQISSYIKKANFDYLHCHDFDALIPGFINKLFNSKIQIIYDEHDLFHLYFEGRKGIINKSISKLIKSIELLMIKRVKHHIVVTPNMCSMYEKVSNPFVVTNAPMKETFHLIEKSEREKIVIGFIGAVRYIDELKILADVVSELSQFSVFIAGKGTKLDELKEYVNERSYSSVEFFGEYNINQLEELYTRIDITYLVYPTLDSVVSLPNKFFESIITRTPMIASKDSEFGKIVENQNFGWCLDTNHLATDITKILISLQNDRGIMNTFRENMIRNGRNYLWESNEKILKDIYQL
jgi:glycosyltransferase involved in cell wall biosynthesis